MVVLSGVSSASWAVWVCSVYSGVDVKWTAVEVYKRNRNNRAREPGQRMHTPLLGGSADSTADGPREGSSVSIMVSLQIIYISPLLLCCPQTHKASFSMLLLAKGVRETSSEVYCGWSKVVRTNAYRHTRTANYSVSTRSTTKLLFLPEWYMCSIFLQLNKCYWGITCIWDVCTSHEPSLLVLGSVGSGCACPAHFSLFVSWRNGFTL